MVESVERDEQENQDTIICDPEDGMFQSLQDLSSASIYDQKEEEAEVKETKEPELLPKAPDGGYGWVICSGVFMNHMVYGGLGRCEGLFFLQFQSKFDTTAQLAAWPGSLMSTVNLFMGPLCGAVVSRYSVRTAFIIGTSLCFTGMLLNGFAPNIFFLFLSHTVLGGTGRGLMSGILLLNLYFDKHRSLATGLGSSGIGVGSLWVVPLTQVLFEEYGFTGAFMILSAVCLHGLVMAMLFRPLRMHFRFLAAKLLRQKLHSSSGSGNNYDMVTTAEDTAETLPDSTRKDSAKDKLYILHEDAETADNEALQETQPLVESSTIVTPDGHTQAESATSTSLSEDLVIGNGHHSTNEHRQVLKETVVIPSIPQQTEEEKGFLNSSLKICFPVEFKREGNSKKVVTHYKDLLKHVPFMVFCLGNFFFLLAFKTAFTFLPAIAMSKGLTRSEAALILTITGALDTFGRIATGFIMDIKVMRPFRPYFFNLLLFIIAGASLMIPSLSTFASYGVVCSVYGFMTGSFVAQKMVVLVDILGREKMPSSLGIQKVFQGFGTLIGPPIAGALRDALGSYDSSFYLGGASMIGAGLMLSLSSVLLRLWNKKKS